MAEGPSENDAADIASAVVHLPVRRAVFLGSGGSSDLHRTPAGWSGTAVVNTRGVFSETQIGCGPSFSYGATGKPPRGGRAPSARAPGRGGHALSGKGSESGSTGFLNDGCP